MSDMGTPRRTNVPDTIVPRWQDPFLRTPHYMFDPLGNTAQTGSSSTNSFAYTGRENDGTELYFLRERYYNPSIGRFISQDPGGLLGGINSYSYADNAPMNHIDPLGLSANDNGIPDCGVDCVLSAEQQQAIEQTIATRDKELSDLEGLDAEPIPSTTAGRKPRIHNEALREACIQTANQNFMSNMQDIAHGTAPDPLTSVGLDSPSGTVPPLAETWWDLIRGLPVVAIGKHLLVHLGISLRAEGGSTVAPFLHYK